MNMGPRGFIPSISGDIAPLEELSSLAREVEDKDGRAGRSSVQEVELSTTQPQTAGNVLEEFYGAGTVLGELGVLEKSSRLVSIECETPVRVSKRICICIVYGAMCIYLLYRPLY